MAFREVTMLEVKEVLRHWLAGRKTKPIARAVGLDPKTVRRYLRVAAQHDMRRGQGEEVLTDERLGAILVELKTLPARPTGEGRALCEQHRDFIAARLGHRVPLTKVHRLLRRQGVAVSYASLYRFATTELGFGKRAVTVPVVDGKPGEELQVDVGLMTLMEPDASGHRRRFKAFVFTPTVSRRRFVYVSQREQTQDAIRACEAAWAFYGGVFPVLLVDNTKAIVHKADPLGAKINATFLEYSQSRGFSVDTARVRDPRGKARVERSIRDVRGDCFGGERLHDHEQAQRRATYWCEHEYGMRRHTTTGRLPKEHFMADEAPELGPAPTEPYDIPHWAEPKVGRDHLAQVCKSLYSLPTKYIGQRLTARADSRTVRFYARGAVVKMHARKPPGGRSIDPNDFPKEKRAYAMRDVDFLITQAADHGECIGLYAQALINTPLPWTRMRQVYALLSLVRRYGAERVEQVSARALREEMYSVRRLEKMILLVAPPAPLPANSNVIPLARHLRPREQYALKPTNKGTKP